MLPDQCKTGTRTNRTRGAGTQVLQLAHSLVVVVVAQIIPLFIVVNDRLTQTQSVAGSIKFTP